MDTSAAHRDVGHEPGSIDVDGATVGVVSPPITPMTPAAVLGSLIFTDGTRPDLPGSGFPIIGGRYAVIVKKYSTTAHIVDCGDPAAPATVATFAPHNGTSQFLSACLIGPATLVMILYDTGADPGPVLEVWDVTTPTAPTYVATGSGPHSQQMEAQCVYGMGTLLVSGTSTNYPGPGGALQLLVWNLATPSAPAFVGACDFPTTTGGPGGGSVPRQINGLLPLDATHVAVVEQSGNIYIGAVSPSAPPTILSSLSIGSNAEGLGLLGTSATIATSTFSDSDGLNRLCLIGIDTLAAPVVTGTAPLLMGTEGMVAIGSCVHLTESGGSAPYLTTYDCADRTAPGLAGRSVVGQYDEIAVLSPTHLVLFGSLDLAVVTVPVLGAPYDAQLGGAGITDGTVRGDLKVSGAVTSHDRPVLESGAVAVGTNTPNRTITVYVDGVPYKVAAIPA